MLLLPHLYIKVLKKYQKNVWKNFIDIFESFLNQSHIVLIQSVLTRYPKAELVKSASAKSVILTLEDMFDLFGNTI